MVKSTITGKEYNPDNSSVVYISNFQQIYKYLCAGAEDDLVDILYTNTRNDCLVFVFKSQVKLSTCMNYGIIMNCKNYILYKIYYGNELVYIGRTSQDLIDRLRLHFLASQWLRS